jgi:peptidoglycan/LPS O-acetylase OafA/YrhL
MCYRREVDGLRALAVVPVIFFHGGFSAFSGGFVGVDVFFVISGYLITSIILVDLRANQFSLVRFYERRARRILPALFLVMAATSLFAYLWMMPDEFKNFGQSLFATATFSNNVLLAITSDYWSLASEFKPLLHTWSLGVEEQYYVIFPLLMILCCAYFRSREMFALGFLFVISMIAAVWGVAHFPTMAFYALPTRAWEILLGALAAYYLAHNKVDVRAQFRNQVLSLIGGVLILSPVFIFSQNYLSPGLTTLAPTVGTVLIILFALEGTIVHRSLSSSVMVGLGLISYSLYLWHQPLFALARVYFVQAPGTGVFAILIALTFVLAYLTWLFVETPFRDSAIVSRRTVANFSVLGSLSLVVFGYYLDVSYGMAWRAFDSQTKIEDVDKRFYNERVFQFKKDSFTSQDVLKVLVIGNSFGRDFVNMTTETFDTKNIEIVYRADLYDCIIPYRNPLSAVLFGSADVIVFASGYRKDCVRTDVPFLQEHGKNVFYVGTKSFGANLNWIIRLLPDERPNQYNRLAEETVALERYLASNAPTDNFISLLAPVVKDGQIPITDNSGRLLSADRAHVTKFGAIFFGEKVLLGSRYGAILKTASHQREASGQSPIME